MTLNSKYILSFLQLVAMSLTVLSQSADTLSFQEVFSMALENNYQLIITRNDAQIAANNNTLGNAGFLPTLDIYGTANPSVTNSNQKFYDGREREATNANNKSYNAFAELNWTLFDGTRMWAAKDRLEELENQGVMNLQLSIELTYLDLATLYYRLVQEQKLYEVLVSTMDVSRSRLRLAEKKMSIGATSELDLNQARIDLAEDSTRLIKQEVIISNLLADINMGMGRLPEIIFAANKEIIPGLIPEYSVLLDSLMAQNYSLLLARSNIRASQLQVRERKASFLPVLSAFADYSYSESSSETGILQSRSEYGISYGATLYYNLFNGFNDKRELTNARIGHQSAIVVADQVKNGLQTDLYKAYNTYEGALQEVALQRSNVENARKNQVIAIELYKAGSMNEIEFRDVQRKETDAENRLLAAEYLTKIAELTIRQLSGTLIF